MSALLQHWSGCNAIDSTDAPDHYLNGIPFESNSCVSIDSTSAISYHHQGLPFTANGRLAVVVDGVFGYVGSGSASFDFAGKLMVTLSGSETDQGHGVGYASRSIKFIEPLFYEMTKPLTTSDWRTNGAGVVEVIEGGDFIKFTPAASKLESWTGIKGGMNIGSTYRCEIDTGDITLSSVDGRIMDANDNSVMGSITLTANTLGADQSFTFVASYTDWSGNLKVTAADGYLEAGILRIWGPLSV
jgi:hypothetical protein